MGSVPYVIKLRVLVYLFMCDYQVSVPTNYFRRRKPPSLVGQSIFSQARLGPRITVQEHKVQLCPITVVPPSLYSRFCDFSVCICICSYGLVHFLYICFHFIYHLPSLFSHIPSRPGLELWRAKRASLEFVPARPQILVVFARCNYLLIVMFMIYKTETLPIPTLSPYLPKRKRQPLDWLRSNLFILYSYPVFIKGQLSRLKL